MQIFTELVILYIFLHQRLFINDFGRIFHLLTKNTTKWLETHPIMVNYFWQCDPKYGIRYQKKWRMYHTWFFPLFKLDFRINLVAVVFICGNVPWSGGWVPDLVQRKTNVNPNYDRDFWRMSHFWQKSQFGCQNMKHPIRVRPHTPQCHMAISYRHSYMSDHPIDNYKPWGTAAFLA